MTMSLTSPVTGGAQTGFTSPTYTLVSDSAPDVNGRQYAVSALGGTQAGAHVSSPSSPFTVSTFKPKVMKATPYVSNGTLVKTGKNTYKVIVRVGTEVVSGYPPDVCVFTLTIDVPAGSDSNTNGAASIRSGCSLMQGALSQIAAGLGDTLITGVM